MNSQLVLSMPKKEVTITVNPAWCKGCGLCVELCPKKVFRMSQEPVETGYFIAEVVHPEACSVCCESERNCPFPQLVCGLGTDLCIACRECELHCPDSAISITPKKK